MAVHVTVLDDTIVTLNGDVGASSVAGPLTVHAESVTVGGTEFFGTVLVKAGAAFRTSPLTPGQSDMLVPSCALMFALAFVAIRLRL